MQIKTTITGFEPISLADAKNYLRVDYTEDDNLITSLISIARECAERYCNRSFIAKQIEYYDPDWISPVTLPYPNHDEILSVKVGDVETTYQVSGLNRKIIKVSSDVEDSALYVKYTTTGNPSEAEKNAIMRIVSEMYENRSTELTATAKAMLAQFKTY